MGGFMAFDVKRGEAEAVQLVDYLRNRGVIVGLGENGSIRLRPTLVAEPIDCGHLIRALDEYPFKKTVEAL